MTTFDFATFKRACTDWGLTCHVDLRAIPLPQAAVLAGKRSYIVEQYSASSVGAHSYTRPFSAFGYISEADLAQRIADDATAPQ